MDVPSSWSVRSGAIGTARRVLQKRFRTDEKKSPSSTTRTTREIRLETVAPRRHSAKMRPSQLAAGLFACAATGASATALTYKLTPNEQACFFAKNERQGAKIAFYFAVRIPFTPSEPNGQPEVRICANTRTDAATGAIRRLFRCRLCRPGPQRPGGCRWAKGAAGRLCLHGQCRRRLPVLLQQRDEHVHGQDGGF